MDYLRLISFTLSYTFPVYLITNIVVSLIGGGLILIADKMYDKDLLSEQIYYPFTDNIVDPLCNIVVFYVTARTSLIFYASMIDNYAVNKLIALILYIIVSIVFLIINSSEEGKPLQSVITGILSVISLFLPFMGMLDSCVMFILNLIKQLNNVPIIGFILNKGFIILAGFLVIVFIIAGIRLIGSLINLLANLLRKQNR